MCDYNGYQIPNMSVPRLKLALLVLGTLRTIDIKVLFEIIPVGRPHPSFVTTVLGLKISWSNLENHGGHCLDVFART